MKPTDYLLFSWLALSRYRLKSTMITIAIAIAVGSVATLSAIGETAKNYVLDQFSFLGSDVLVMFPGRNETTGGLPPVTGAAARNITLADAEALQQRIPAVVAVAPIVVGSAEVSAGALSREVIIMGTSATFIHIRQMELALGRNLARRELSQSSNECLVGETLRRALFQNRSVIGQVVRVQDYRCRVVGVLAGRGDAFGMDLSDSLILPVASAQKLFNTEALFRVALQLRPDSNIGQVKSQVLDLMTQLHQGELDVTLISPDAMLSTFDQIFTAMMLGVAAIGSISLLVAGLLIMNITLINVSQRTQEIGLLKALGASSIQVLRFFVLESLLLGALGSALGIVGAHILLQLASHWLPVVLQAPLWSLLLATAIALLASWLFSWLPARHAAILPPIDALQGRG